MTWFEEHVLLFSSYGCTLYIIVHYDISYLLSG